MSNTNFYFHKLRSLVETDKVEFYLLISPSRSGSTLMELVLSDNGNFDYVCHEPFMETRKGIFDVDLGYENIYNKIEGKKIERLDRPKKVKVLIKEMGHWLYLNNEYEKVFSLTKVPVIFLIRNPMLTTESRMKKVLENYGQRPEVGLLTFLQSELKIGAEVNISHRGYNSQVNLQLSLLDKYATSQGFDDWKSYVDNNINERRYFKFEQLLSLNTRRVFFEKREFVSIWREVQFCKDSNIKYMIIDLTDFRLQPEYFLNQISTIFNLNKINDIDFTKFKDRFSNFDKADNNKFGMKWYSQVLVSNKIEKPQELIPHIEDFPLFMQTFISKVHLPLYFQLSDLKLKIPEDIMGLNEITKIMSQLDPIYLETTSKRNLEIKYIFDPHTLGEDIDIVDTTNRIIDVCDTRLAHEQKLLHRVVGILLFDLHGNLYFQSGTKYNLLDLSVGGHVMKGETYLDAAYREMEEELNLKTELTELTVFYPENAKFGHFWSVYEGVAPENWTFKPTAEVPDLVKMKFRDVLQKFENTPEIFTKGFQNVFAEYLKIKNK